MARSNDMMDETGIGEELDGLIGDDVSTVLDRERTAFDSSLERFGKSIVLYGAGNLGRRVLNRLRQDGCEPLAFADGNPDLWGGNVEGLPVLPPERAADQFGKAALFIVTIWSPGRGNDFGDIRRELTKLQCSKVISFVPLFWKYAETFLPSLFFDLPHKIRSSAAAIRSAFSLWADAESRECFVSQIRWTMSTDSDPQPPSADEQYFPARFFSVSEDDVFVDCGAFTGDTIRRYIELTEGSFRGVYAFEPDPFNFSLLENYLCGLPAVLRDRIQVRQAAVGEREEQIRFDASGTISSGMNTRGNLHVDSVSLDAALAGCSPTYIKMDIEGAEMAALRGARHTIENHHPVLAVSVYHRYDDLWMVPMYLHSLSEDYRLFLRAHDVNGLELVCYAIPGGRREGGR